MINIKLNKIFADIVKGNIRKLWFSVLIICCSVISCKNQDNRKIYDVKFTSKIDIDNLLSDETWSNANVISDFCMPWDSDPAQETLLRALFDDENIYFIFNTLESDLVFLDSVSAEMDLAEVDRVEVYFSYSEALDDYYCFEVDPYGRVLDYKAKSYRKFDMEWDLDQIMEGMI
jgi:cellulose/xylan binding protein with CBM9 domain